MSTFIKKECYISTLIYYNKQIASIPKQDKVPNIPAANSFSSFSEQAIIVLIKNIKNRNDWDTAIAICIGAITPNIPSNAVIADNTNKHNSALIILIHPKL